MSEYTNLRMAIEDRVAILTIDHPPANAFNRATITELGAAMDELIANDQVKVIIITGAGEKGFSAGMDVSDIANIAKGPNGNEIMNAISRSTKPYIAAINGHALGGGCETAIACHFRIMTDNPKALIGLPEVNLGITPGWGGIQRLPRLLGKPKALDMILFSKRLTPVEALAIGLVDKVVPAADLMKEATAFAQALAKRPPLAVADCSASSGSGSPVALTVKVRTTPVVAVRGPGFASNTGALAAATFTVTVCVAVPSVLLAVKVKVWTVPPSDSRG